MNSLNLINLLRLFNIKFLNNNIGNKKISQTLLLINKESLNNNNNNNINNYREKLFNWFTHRKQSISIIKLYAKKFKLIKPQCFVNIYKFKLIHLYKYKFINESIIRELIHCWKCKKFIRNSRDFFFSAIGVTVFNWDQQRINDNELFSYANEIELIQDIQKRTIICKNCNLRLIINNQQPNIDYCRCQGTNPGAIAINSDEDWQPFIEKNDMIIWRREEPNSNGLYAYKIFGYFPDVSANEFLQVQIDIDYRKMWDSTAKQLEIIDSDPNLISDEYNRNDIIYWEMIWPRLFSNRDYVYQRRWVVDKEKGVIIIVSRSINHPNAPNRPDTYRVESYWSYTIIKPCKDFNEPGIEFGLTYFDDAGVNIPSAVSSWVASNDLPDFLCRMRQAAKNYKNYLNDKEQKNVNNNIYTDDEKFKNKNDEKLKKDDDNDGDNDNRKNLIENDEKIESKDNNSEELINDENESGIMRYFFLTKLFA